MKEDSAKSEDEPKSWVLKAKTYVVGGGCCKVVTLSVEWTSIPA